MFHIYVVFMLFENDIDIDVVRRPFANITINVVLFVVATLEEEDNDGDDHVIVFRESEQIN